MATISTTNAEMRAHSPDPAMMARLRATRDVDTTSDPDEATGEPVFTIRAVIRRRFLSGAYQDGDIAAYRAAPRHLPPMSQVYTSRVQQE
jgi:hypothetical protein